LKFPAVTDRRYKPHDKNPAEHLHQAVNGRITCSCQFFSCAASPSGFNLGQSDNPGMWWSKPSFKKKFGQIEGGWNTCQVLDLIGSPLEVEDSEIPLGSDWGSQPGMTFQMKPGDLVKQWMYEDRDEFYYIWFAQVRYANDDPWEVTLKKIMSHRIAA
jgi:hypothetical protein